jgi:hypothetical protein
MVTILCVYPGAIGLQARKLAPFKMDTHKDSNLELMGWSYVPQYLPQLHSNVGKSLMVHMIPFRVKALQRGMIQ